jgi:uncharacterized membrane protein YqjE
MSTTTQSSSGIGFFGLLTVLFIGLKLTNFITWSWWWVLSPLWFGFALALAILIIALVVLMVTALLGGVIVTHTKPVSTKLQERLKNMQNNRNIKK